MLYVSFLEEDASGINVTVIKATVDYRRVMCITSKIDKNSWMEWNLSIVVTIGTGQSVLIREVPLYS